MNRNDQNSHVTKVQLQADDLQPRFRSLEVLELVAFVLMNFTKT